MTLTEDQKKILKNAIYEASATTQFIEDKRELFKDIVERVKNECDISPRHFRNLVKEFHKGKILEAKEAVEEYQFLLDVVSDSSQSSESE